MIPLSEVGARMLEKSVVWRTLMAEEALKVVVANLQEEDNLCSSCPDRDDTKYWACKLGFKSPNLKDCYIEAILTQVRIDFVNGGGVTGMEDRLVPILEYRQGLSAPYATVRRKDCPKWIAYTIQQGIIIPQPDAAEECHKGGFRDFCYWAMQPKEGYSVCAYDRQPWYPIHKGHIDTYLAMREEGCLPCPVTKEQIDRYIVEHKEKP